MPRVFLFCLALLSGLFSVQSAGADTALKFGVLNRHPVALTAQIWNPILHYVSRKVGVPLVLAMGKAAPETTERTVAGEYDFAYSNHLFTPEREKLGFQVIARLNRPAIASQIVVAADAPLRVLADLAGKAVAFPSREAFVGYHVPRLALGRAGIEVKASFGGNQEGAMQQLAAGAADAAAVNDQVMRAFAARHGFRYRVLWASEPYPDLAVMAHRRVPAAMVEKVRTALLGMRHDAEGRAALDAANAIVKNAEPLAFVAATEADYAPYRRFWRAQAEHGAAR